MLETTRYIRVSRTSSNELPRVMQEGMREEHEKESEAENQEDEHGLEDARYGKEEDEH